MFLEVRNSASAFTRGSLCPLRGAEHTSPPTETPLASIHAGINSGSIHSGSFYSEQLQQKPAVHPGSPIICCHIVMRKQGHRSIRTRHFREGFQGGHKKNQKDQCSGQKGRQLAQTVPPQHGRLVSSGASGAAGHRSGCGRKGQR